MDSGTMDVAELAEVLKQQGQEDPMVVTEEKAHVEALDRQQQYEAFAHFHSEMIVRLNKTATEDLSPFLVETMKNVKKLDFDDSYLQRKAGIAVMSSILTGMFTKINAMFPPEYQIRPRQDATGEKSFLDYEFIAKMFLREIVPESYGTLLPKMFNLRTLLEPSPMDHIFKPLSHEEVAALSKIAVERAQMLDQDMKTLEEISSGSAKSSVPMSEEDLLFMNFRKDRLAYHLSILRNAKDGMPQYLNTVDLPDRWRVVSDDWILVHGLKSDECQYWSGQVVDEQRANSLLKLIDFKYQQYLEDLRFAILKNISNPAVQEWIGIANVAQLAQVHHLVEARVQNLGPQDMRKLLTLKIEDFASIAPQIGWLIYLREVLKQRKMLPYGLVWEKEETEQEAQSFA